MRIRHAILRTIAALVIALTTLPLATSPAAALVSCTWASVDPLSGAVLSRSAPACFIDENDCVSQFDPSCECIPSPECTNQPTEPTFQQSVDAFLGNDKPYSPPLSIDIPTVQFTKIKLGQSDSEYLTIPWIGQYISGVYAFAVTFAFTVAAVMVVVGGFQMLTAGGDAGRYGKGKEHVVGAITGMALVLAAYVILYTVSPNLTRFDALQVKRTARIPFAENETPAAEIDNSSGAQTPAGPAGPLTPTTIQHFAQCGTVGRSTPYLAKGGRCADNGAGQQYTLCTSGCGVASATMVIASLTGRNANELAPELARISSENGCRPCNSNCSDCSGTVEDCLVDNNIIGRYGLQSTAMSDRELVTENLRQGKAMIALYQNSMFTKNGHYIVLAALNPDGTVRVLDPGKGVSPYNYNCEMVRRSSPLAPCPISSDRVPADLIFGKGYSGGWLLQPKPQQ